MWVTEEMSRAEVHGKGSYTGGWADMSWSGILMLNNTERRAVSLQLSFSLFTAFYR